MQHGNSTINWVPEHLKEGRFGKWIEGAKDWAFSRDRFWGTPLPIWKCDDCDETVCLGSVAELEERKELANTRATVLTKQETRIKETLKEQEAKINQMVQSSASGASTSDTPPKQQPPK